MSKINEFKKMVDETGVNPKMVMVAKIMEEVMEDAAKDGRIYGVLLGNGLRGAAADICLTTKGDLNKEKEMVKKLMTVMTESLVEYCDHIRRVIAKDPDIGSMIKEAEKEVKKDGCKSK